MLATNQLKYSKVGGDLTDVHSAWDYTIYRDEKIKICIKTLVYHFMRCIKDDSTSDQQKTPRYKIKNIYAGRSTRHQFVIDVASVLCLHILYDYQVLFQ